LKTKYLYFLIAGLMVAVVAYPVVYALINNYAAVSDPFFCAPLIPCQQPPSGVVFCPSNCTIVIRDSSFSPGTVNASVGATITWVNEDGFSHTVSAFNTSAFESPVVPPGHFFKLTVPKSMKPGSYYYFCEVHPFMIGLLNVMP
jgi:plastocyanin